MRANGVKKKNGMVWYGMVTLFKHGISIRYTFTLKNRNRYSVSRGVKQVVN